MPVVAIPCQLDNFSLSGAGSSIGDTVLNLKSFKDILSVNLTMSDFGSIGYGTIEPGNGVQEEQISFSGITQNSDGTAQLTGVKHVLFKTPFTETSGMTITHPGSVVFVITNTSGFENAIYSYINTVSASGGVPATQSNIGITRLSQDPTVIGTPIAVGVNTSYSGIAISTSNNAIDFGAISQTAASGKVVQALSSGYISDTFINSTAFAGAFFSGDGSDGTVTISSPTTLTRDMYYNTLTVNSTLTTDGYQIFVLNTIAGTGTIKWGTPTVGTAGSGGSGGGGGASSGGGKFKTLAGGGGGSGGTGAGTAGTSSTSGIGSGGGAGGDNSGSSGGAGGAASTISIFTKFGVLADLTLKGTDINTSAAYVFLKGGGGGGGGGGGQNGSGTGGGGGGGGAGGGVVSIFAKTWSGTFVIDVSGANGGNGANATGGNNAYGGGGGGGGGGGASLVVYVTKTWTGSYLLTAGTSGAGGSPTAGGGSGASGTAGTAGTSKEIVMGNLTR